MGASNSKVPAVDVQERLVSQSESFPWAVNNGVLANGNKCSIFVHKKNGLGSVETCREFIKNIKLCRHPYILHYIESQEDADAVYLVTEPVIPLASVIKELNEIDIALGVYTVATALDFLHNSAGMMHNNVKLSSIFISQSDNLWRLGGMALVCPFANPKDTLIGNVIRAASPESPASPEDIDGTYSSNSVHCRDSWMLGHLIVRLFDRFNGTSDGKLVKFKQTIKKSFCSADPRKRPPISSFLNNPYFQTLPQQALIESVEFLQAITIKSDEEKQSYFRKASNDLFHVSSGTFQKYLMKLIFSDLIFADENAREFLLPRLLSVKTNRESKGFYKAESFFRIMGPMLQDLFKRRAKHTRLVLLRLSRFYIPFLPTHFVKDYILPEVLLGLKDTDDGVVMATFNGLAILTSVLGSTVVVGGERKSNFLDAFPRGFDIGATNTTSLDDGTAETTFTQALNGNIVNDSDLDSGKEYTLAHESQLQAEKEKRAEEFKKRRAALNRKRKEQQERKDKLIEVAAAPSSNAEHANHNTSSLITSETVNPEILKKERFTHQHSRPMLVHERAGYTMEYVGEEGTANAGAWDVESGPDLQTDEDEEVGNQESLLQIVQRHSEEEEREEGEGIWEKGIEGDDSTPVNLSRMSPRPPDSEERGSRVSDSFSKWENGGWSDFDNQFESSDAGVELQEAKNGVKEEDGTSKAPSTVSDFMNFEISVAPEPEPDFFADMQPTYQAPKML